MIPDTAPCAARSAALLADGVRQALRGRRPLEISGDDRRGLQRRLVTGLTRRGGAGRVGCLECTAQAAQVLAQLLALLLEVPCLRRIGTIF